MENWKQLIPILEQNLSNNEKCPSRLFSLIEKNLLLHLTTMANTQSLSQLKSLNLWLIKGMLIGTVNSHNDENVFAASLKLQQSLLLAYSTNQPALLQPVVGRYIEMANALVATIKNSRGKFHYEFLTQDEMNELAGFQLNQELYTIKCTSEARINTLSRLLLNLFKDIVLLMDSTELETMNAIRMVTVEFFQWSKVPLKCYALQVIVQVFEQQINITKNDANMGIGILDRTITILKCGGLNEVANSFAPILHRLIVLLRHYNDDDVHNKLNTVVLAIIMVCTEHPNYLRPLLKLMVDDLSNVIFELPNNDVLEKLETWPDILNIYKAKLVTELCSGSTALWDALTEKLVEMQSNALIQNYEATETWETGLLKWHTIFIFLQSTSEILSVTSPSRKTMYDECLRKLLHPFLPRFLPPMFNLDQRTCLTFNAVAALRDLVYSLCNLQDSLNVLKQYQIDFFHVLIAPLSRVVPLNGIPQQMVDTFSGFSIQDKNYALLVHDSLRWSLACLDERLQRNTEVLQCVYNVIEHLMNMNNGMLQVICIDLAIDLIYATRNVPEICKRLIYSKNDTETLHEAYSATLEKLTKMSSKTFWVIKKRMENYVYIEVLHESDLAIDEKKSIEWRLNDYLKNNSATLVSFKMSAADHIELRKCIELLCKNLNIENPTVAMNIVKILPNILETQSFAFEAEFTQHWLKILTSANIGITSTIRQHIDEILDVIHRSQRMEEEFSLQLLGNFQKAMYASFRESAEVQLNIIHAVCKFGQSKVANECDVVLCVLIGIMYASSIDSDIRVATVFPVREMIVSRDLIPKQLFGWYKEAFMKQMIEIAISNYVEYSTPLNFRDSLKYSVKIFNEESLRTFVNFNFNYKHINAVLLPWVLEYPQLEEPWMDMLTWISDKSPNEVLGDSYLVIFSFAYRYYSSETADKCTKLIEQKIDMPIENLLKMMKSSIYEVLVYYQPNNNMIVKLFKYLSKSTNEQKEIIDYLTKNFQGIIYNFENYLTNVNCDKCVKKNVLLSIGEIIRVLGAEHVSPSRFKILALLHTAVSGNEKYLQKACVKVWTIFLHTVDLLNLGSLLSSIVLALKPLIDNFPVEINDIFMYLFVTSESLLSRYFDDLFFIDELNIKRELKQHVLSRQKKSNVSLVEQLSKYLTHIRHENVSVRSYGLKYLTKLIKENRVETNNLVLSQKIVHPILIDIFKSLLSCCKEKDRDLQICAAECLGELGAMESSLMPPNYEIQSNFAFSIHTNEFAIVSLKELCRAYQVETHTKSVDCFALAIQEVLLIHNINPHTNSKVELWASFPERMKQIMEPLLSTNYASLKAHNESYCHPIFSATITFEEWAFLWSTKMIYALTVSDTQRLLDSFRFSLKRDINILSLIFPYIVLHAIQLCSPEEVQEIYEELKTVFESEQQEANREQANSKLLRLENLKKQMMEDDLTTPLENIDKCAKDKCAKVGFRILDFLQQWIREYQSKKVKEHYKEAYKAINAFLNKFDAKLIALANFECGEYARALFYLEKYIAEDHSNRFQGELPLLARIHAELFDADSVEGLMNLKEVEPSLEEQILLYNIAKRYHEATACFERLLQVNLATPDLIKEMIDCYLKLDQPEMALLFSESCSNLFPSDTVPMQAARAEPLLRLSRWDDLDALLNVPDITQTDIWGVNYGKVMLNFRQEKYEDFTKNLCNIRHILLRSFKSHENEQSIYQKSYGQILKLHMLTELQKACEMVQTLPQGGTPLVEKLSSLLKDWSARSDLLQPTASTMEPILCLRRIILQELNELLCRNAGPREISRIKETIDENIGKLWIQSTELASKAKMYHQAQLYIMNAEAYKPKELFIEKAKLHWEKGDQFNSFKVLDMGINDLMQAVGGDVNKLTAEDKKVLGQAKLINAEFNAKSMNVNADSVTACFKEAIPISQTENGYVLLAQHIQRCYNAMSETVLSLGAGDELLFEQMNFYGTSLMYGTSYVYQSMPATLTVWLDYTAQEAHKNNHITEQMNKLMSKLAETLPQFTFFTAFSQLISRICHSNMQVYKILKSILLKLIQTYPQQALWMILSVAKSSYEIRVKRCSEILNDRSLAYLAPDLKNLHSFTMLLISLTDASITNLRKGQLESTVDQFCPELLRFFKDRRTEIIMPTQKQMLLTLPPSNYKTESLSEYNPFPNRNVYIISVRSKVNIMPSLLKPKRITLKGSDGRDYSFLMKPKDDLRKDSRLMEFNGVIKQYLYQDIEARQRRLNIRTYGVLPLNDECGIIEWVPNLITYRTAVMNYYKLIGKGINQLDVKNNYCQKSDSLKRKREHLEKRLLPHFPSIFGEWFKERFPNPHNWYQARCAYIKTLAVMSVAGYVLGLGDRHGDNILLDFSNGDIIHVDFGCLFNKGETLDWPELVPFRLTHNFVHAMGPQGAEGLFRKCCEITMRVMHSHEATLMSVLRPFIYDPMVNWTTKSVKKPQNMQVERTDADTKNSLDRVCDRLNGFIYINKKRTTLPLSDEGHVNYLITEATDINKLCCMFWGWGPYY